jgi:restriction system protein
MFRLLKGMKDMSKTLWWMVRAGEGGYLFDDFYNNNYVAIGWNDLGDIMDATSMNNIRDLYNKHYTQEKPSKVNNAVAMIFKFRSVLKEGHKVVTYNPKNREYAIGLITSDYKFAPGREYHHIREVQWQGIINRDDLNAASRNSLGSTLALFSINEDTADDLIRAQQGKKIETEEEKEELEQLKEDTVSRAHELIKDKILKLNEEEVVDLVASLLRAMKYKARVTSKGPDRGVDVIASPDGLGLEEPRIKVEVKHRSKTTMGSQDIRSFLGGMRQGDRALYVSTGGYSKDANYEADRSNIPITLVDLDMLATLLVEHYENFDMDGKVLIPLTRLYWPLE